jgi:acyl-CoA synthetase (AMP-forming)/AMP-acid ligase II/acyl carrier protein
MSIQLPVRQGGDTEWPATVHGLLAAQVERRPDAEAILAPGRVPLTYDRLCHQVDAVVAALNARGLGRGDRVALALPDGPELAVAILGVAAGATACPLNPSLTVDECSMVLGGLNARALIVPAGTASPLPKAAAMHGIPVIKLVVPTEAEAGVFTLAGAEGSRPPDRSGFAEPDDVALLLHTSGTTARPKQVPLTHANLSAFAAVIAAELSADDRGLNLLPLFHISFGSVIGAVAAGSSIVCPPGFHVARVFDWLNEFRPTWFLAVPTMLQAILDRVPGHESVLAQSRLRVIASGAASLPTTLLAAMEEAFGVPILEAYGLTETGWLTTNSPSPAARKLGSVGLSRDAEIAVVDEAGGPLPAGTIGEIVARGPAIMAGYDGDAAATAAAFFPGGWFRTGDLGYLDADGYLFLTGRLKELINRGGEKVSPHEVEAALLEHPAVGQVVAFAMPDERLGEDIAAAVVLRAGVAADERELRRFAAERLAYHKLPRRIVFLDALPMGPTGKPRRIGLAQTLDLAPLPLPESMSEDGFVPPRTPLEGVVAGIWREVLGLERVGVADDFLALGGDSVQAAQVAARLRETLGVAIPMATFFETPTVADLAREVEQVVESTMLHLLAETETSSPLAPQSLSTNGTR